LTISAFSEAIPVFTNDVIVVVALGDESVLESSSIRLVAVVLMLHP